MRRRELITGVAAAATMEALPSLSQGAIVSPPGSSNNAAAADAARRPGYDVTQKGVTDDGQKGYFLATQTNGGTTLTIASGACNITVANTGPNGVALVTFPGATSGNALSPSESWRRCNIAIDGAGDAGATLAAIVADVYIDISLGLVVQLDRPAPTTYTNTSHTFACPCFDASAVNKGIWLANGGGVAGGGGNPLTTVGVPFATTIAGYTSPYSVTLAAAITGPTMAAKAGCLIVWGTDNSSAMQGAGDAARAAKKSVLWFPGLTYPSSTGLFCAFNFIIDSVASPSGPNYDASLTSSALRWVTNEAETFFTPTPGLWEDETLYATAIPATAGQAPPPKVTINALSQLLRCNTQSTIKMLIIGDSSSNQDPSGEGNAFLGMFVAEFQRQNPSKRVIPVYSGVIGLTWQGLVPSIGSSSTVTVDGLGTVTPDLVVLAVTGGNDGLTIFPNDILTCINTVRSWPTANGLPPDIIMIAVAPRRTSELGSSGQADYGALAAEYAMSLQLSMARVMGIPILDIATPISKAIIGWAPDSMILKHVPGLPSGTASLTAPYIIPYRCRDFLIALELGTAGQTGADFWAAAKTLHISLSGKPDNRGIISPDGSGNLTVMATLWGYTVSTICALANGSAALTTSGQTSFTPGLTSAVQGYNYTYQIQAANLPSGMVGQCYWQNGMQAGGLPLRTYIFSYTNPNNAFGADPTAQAATSTTGYWGGQMFLPNDAGTADCVIAGAGTVAHPLTGANSLVTKVMTVGGQFTCVLNDVNSQSNIAGPVNVFLGRISLQPTYINAVAAGADAGANQVLVVELKNNHLKVASIPGGTNLSDIRIALQSHQTLVIDCDIEKFGAPFSPRIWAGSSVTITPLFVWADDRDVSWPELTQRQAFGTGEAIYSNPWGGDTGHPSHALLNRIANIAGVQRLATGTDFRNNFAPVVATTAGYTIPANQAFTDLTPAGTLGTCPVTLPGVFPQGGRLEIFTSQVITTWAISAPSGFSIAGPVVSAATAGQTVAYRLTGTTWTRVQ